MEVAVLHAENVPDGCLLSLTAGSSRRQARLKAGQKFAFGDGARLSSSARGGSGLKLDVLSLQGSARIPAIELAPGLGGLVPAGGHRIEVPFPYSGGRGESMKLSLSIRPTKGDMPAVFGRGSRLNTARTLDTARSPDASAEEFPHLSAASSAMPAQSSLYTQQVLKGPKAAVKGQPMSQHRHQQALEATAYLDSHGILPFLEAVLRALVQEKPVDPWGRISDMLPRPQHEAAQEATLAPKAQPELLQSSASTAVPQTTLLESTQTTLRSTQPGDTTIGWVTDDSVAQESEAVVLQAALGDAALEESAPASAAAPKTFEESAPASAAAPKTFEERVEAAQQALEQEKAQRVSETRIVEEDDQAGDPTEEDREAVANNFVLKCVPEMSLASLSRETSPMPTASGVTSRPGTAGAARGARRQGHSVGEGTFVPLLPQLERCVDVAGAGSEVTSAMTSAGTRGGTRPSSAMGAPGGMAKSTSMGTLEDLRRHARDLLLKAGSDGSLVPRLDTAVKRQQDVEALRSQAASQLLRSGPGSPLVTALDKAVSSHLESDAALRARDGKVRILREQRQELQKSLIQGLARPSSAADLRRPSDRPASTVSAGLGSSAGGSEAAAAVSAEAVRSLEASLLTSAEPVPAQAAEQAAGPAGGALLQEAHAEPPPPASSGLLQEAAGPAGGALLQEAAGPAGGALLQEAHAEPPPPASSGLLQEAAGPAGGALLQEAHAEPPPPVGSALLQEACDALFRASLDGRLAEALARLAAPAAGSAAAAAGAEPEEVASHAGSGEDEVDMAAKVATEAVGAAADTGATAGEAADGQQAPLPSEGGSQVDTDVASRALFEQAAQLSRDAAATSCTAAQQLGAEVQSQVDTDVASRALLEQGAQISRGAADASFAAALRTESLSQVETDVASRETFELGAQLGREVVDAAHSAVAFPEAAAAQPPAACPAEAEAAPADAAPAAPEEPLAAPAAAAAALHAEPAGAPAAEPPPAAAEEPPAPAAPADAAPARAEEAEPSAPAGAEGAPAAEPPPAAAEEPSAGAAAAEGDEAPGAPAAAAEAQPAAEPETAHAVEEAQLAAEPDTAQAVEEALAEGERLRDENEALRGELGMLLAATAGAAPADAAPAEAAAAPAAEAEGPPAAGPPTG